ncbi:MAG: hypothetical protein GYA55_08430, partial [SAR324 cluster bacterium]|nr:hypothetical protein [SAR324 cluster bacterium]
MGKRYFGLCGSSPAWLIAEIASSAKQVLLICKDKRSVESIEADLRFFLGSEQVLVFSDWDILPFEPLSPQAFISADRIATLNGLLTRKNYVCVTSIDTLAQKILEPSFIESTKFEIYKNSPLERDALRAKLSALGYSEVSLVEETGECAIRGSVVDIFASGLSKPVRVHFDAGSIAAIKTFDPDSQRTLDEIHSFLLLPVKEYSFDFCPFQEIVFAIKLRAKELEVPPREVARITRALRIGTHFPGVELFQS